MLRSLKFSLPSTSFTNSNFNGLNNSFTNSQNFKFLTKNFNQFTIFNNKYNYKYNYNLSTVSKRTYSSKEDDHHGHGNHGHSVTKKQTLEEREKEIDIINELIRKREELIKVKAQEPPISLTQLNKEMHELKLRLDDYLHENKFSRESIEKLKSLGMDPIAAEWEHATGIERAQIEIELSGETIEDEIRGPFGTWENPVIVPSYYHFRLVGCLGHEGKTQHELLWHEVKIGKPLICVECGQVFKLQRVPLPGHEDDPRYKEEEKGNYFIPQPHH